MQVSMPGAGHVRSACLRSTITQCAEVRHFKMHFFAVSPHKPSLCLLLLLLLLLAPIGVEKLKGAGTYEMTNK